MSGEHGFPLKLISSLSMLVDLLYRLGKLAEASQKSKNKSTCKCTLLKVARSSLGGG